MCFAGISASVISRDLNIIIGYEGPSMKILHVTKKYHPMTGGDAYVTYNLKKQQHNMGHQVYILVSNCDEIDQNDHVLNFGLKDRSSDLDKITLRRIISLFLLFFQAFGTLNKLKPSIIHSHSADLGFVISFAARIYGIPVINTCHGISFNDKQYCFPKRFAEKFFLKHASFKKIITVDKTGLECLQNMGIGNAIHIPNGVDIHKFHKIRAERPGEITRFLFTGRLEKQKGVEYLLKATDLLNGNDLLKATDLLNGNDLLKATDIMNGNDFEVIITGDGKHKDKLMSLTKQLHLEDRVTFTGRLDDEKLLEQYLKCDIFVLPSLWEGLPLTLMEAASAGLPIITTCVGGITSVFVHKESALLVNPKKPDELARNMQILMLDKELQNKLRNNARMLAENHSWENSAERLDRVYNLYIKNS